MAQVLPSGRGKKRTRNGTPKVPQDAVQSSRPQQVETPTTEPTPPGAQPPSGSLNSTDPSISENTERQPKKQKPNPAKPTDSESSQPIAKRQTKHPKKPKLPKLPSNTTISKRPLLRPAIPTPFSSASSPKDLYVKASTPFIPQIKRIRKLLAEIGKRERQSQSENTLLPTHLSRQAQQKHQKKARKQLRANGRLDPADVEREIVEGSKERLGGTVGEKKGGREEVFVKATGRAIPKALEIGVFFQEDGGFGVRVETGSVCAVDDIEVRDGEEENEGEGKGKGRDENDGGPGAEKKGKKSIEKSMATVEDIPKTRVRTLSAVTVAISTL